MKDTSKEANNRWNKGRKEMKKERQNRRKEQRKNEGYGTEEMQEDTRKYIMKKKIFKQFIEIQISFHSSG